MLTTTRLIEFENFVKNKMSDIRKNCPAHTNWDVFSKVDNGKIDQMFSTFFQDFQLSLISVLTK